MKIAHFSDLHSDFFKISHLSEIRPDLVICTGDMLPNFPLMEVTWEDGESRAYRGYHEMYADLDKEKDRRVIEFGRRIDPVYEKRCQDAWISDPDVRIVVDCPVVVVRGNHDFTDLHLLFDAPEIFEIQDPKQVYQFGDFRIGGFRGIPEIVGEWSDEKSDSELDSICGNLPDLDIVLTHCPPRDILDFGGHSHGSTALKRYVEERRPRLSCFGHIHECGGVVSSSGDHRFSNAATRLNVLEF